MQKMGYPRNPAPFVMLALAAGQGSQVERQLYSLLATMVKVAQCSIGTLLDVACAQYCCAAADAAQALLSGPTGTPSAECSSVPAAAIEMLPCVVIVGRCCIQWGDQMLADPRILLGEDEDRAGKLEIEVDQAPFTVQQWLTAGSACNQLAAAGYAPHAVLQQLQQHLDARLATSVLQGGSPDTAAAVPESQEPSFDTVAAVVQTQEPSPHIAASALETQVPSSATAAVVMEAHQPLADTAAAVMQVQEPLPDTAAAVAEAQELKSLGLALCSCAVPCMCNNPGCTSLSGLSELASVLGRSCVCGGCLVARYCGRACQPAVWKQHKPMCAALSAAAAGSAGAAADASSAGGS